MLKRKKIKLILMMLMVMLLSSICGCKTEKADIFVTIYPIEFITKSIVKDELVVKSVYPMGTDVHEYDPPLKTVLGMADSEAIIYLGAGLEAFMESAVTTTLKDNRILELSDYLNMIDPSVGDTNNSTRESQEKPHTVDPHVWLDPTQMIIMTEKILELVTELKPECESLFIQNALQLKTELQKIDNEYMEALSDESIANKIMLVDHNAYLYLQYRYNIQIIKTRIDNDSTEIIASDYIKNLKTISDNNIKYIVTTLHENRSAAVDRYISDAKVTEISLHHLSNITKDESMQGQTYFTIMRKNLETLVQIMPKK